MIAGVSCVMLMYLSVKSSLLMLSTVDKTALMGEMSNRLSTSDMSLFSAQDKFNDLLIEKYVNKGMVSLGFNAILRSTGQQVFVKITGHSTSKPYFEYSDNEVATFKILNKAPTVPTIPKLHWAIRSMPNPFKSQVSYISESLHIQKNSTASWLGEQELISVQVLERGNHLHVPGTMSEIRAFTKSVLATLRFAHSRNIANVDLYMANCLFDGQEAFLFDWNDAVIVNESGKTPLRLYQMVPPEAENLTVNEIPYHINVWAFDVWTVGKMLRRLLRNCCSSLHSMRLHGATSVDMKQAKELVALMLHPDPYQRPSTEQLLKHSFFGSVEERGPST